MGVIHPGKPIAGFTAYPTAINDTGVIAGYLSFYKGGDVAFVRPLHGPSEYFGVNGSRGTRISGINASGTVTGYYADPIKGIYRGLVRAADGTVTLLDCPGEYPTTQPYGINASGQVVGSCFVNSPLGFIYTP